MATGMESNVRFSCSLCMESYRGRNPKLLPCFHTFCSPCLNSIVTSAGWTQSALYVSDDLPAGTSTSVDEPKQARSENQQSSEKVSSVDKSADKTDDSRAAFECPTCRAFILVPEGGVSQFQTNFYIDFDDSTRVTEPVICDTCEDGSRETATHECGDCHHKMCSRCSRLHAIHAQGHHMRPIEPSAVGKSSPRAVKTRECPSHSGQWLCLYCRQCDDCICLNCKLTSHEGHAMDDIKAVVTRAKGEMTRLIAIANQQIQVLESVLGRLGRDSVEISRQKEEMTSNVTSKYGALVAWATRARDEALEELESVQWAALKEMEAERIVAQDTKQLLSRLVTRATSSCHADADADAVLYKSELQASLLDDDTLTQYRHRGGKEGQVTFFTCRSDDKAVHLDQVRDFVGRQEGQDRNAHDKMAVMSVRELSETAVALTKAMNDLKNTLTKNAAWSVFFEARTSTDTRKSGNQDVVFDEVDINEGECYDENTGIFTAPVRGIYFFEAFIFNEDAAVGEEDTMSLSVDGEEMVAMCYLGQSEPIKHTIHLLTGSKVSVVLRTVNDYPIEVGHESSFFGALLGAMVTDD